MTDTLYKALQFLAEYEMEQREKASGWVEMGGHASVHIRTPVAEAANNRANAIAALIAELRKAEIESSNA